MARRRVGLALSVVMVLIVASGAFPGIARASTFSGLCNHVVNDTGSPLPVVDVTLQFNGSTWVLSHVGNWLLLYPGAYYDVCIRNFSGVTFKETYFWDNGTQTPYLWTWAASTLVNAADPN